jgi:hypothetical protein
MRYSGLTQINRGERVEAQDCLDIPYCRRLRRRLAIFGSFSVAPKRSISGLSYCFFKSFSLQLLSPAAQGPTLRIRTTWHRVAGAASSNFSGRSSAQPVVEHVSEKSSPRVSFLEVVGPTQADVGFQGITDDPFETHWPKKSLSRWQPNIPREAHDSGPRACLQDPTCRADTLQSTVTSRVVKELATFGGSDR